MCRDRPASTAKFDMSFVGYTGDKKDVTVRQPRLSLFLFLFLRFGINKLSGLRTFPFSGIILVIVESLPESLPCMSQAPFAFEGPKCQCFPNNKCKESQSVVSVSTRTRSESVT